MTENKLDAAKRRITALLDRADHPNTSEHEAAACRDKAESMMAEYRIERAMLHLKGHDKRRFEVKEFKVSYRLASVFTNIFSHVNCHVAISGKGYSVVGYPEDIFYGETLFQRAQTELHSALQPTWRDDRTVEANIYAFRRAGIAWDDVYSAIPVDVKEEMGILTYSVPGLNKVRYRFRKEEQRLGAPKFVWHKSRSDFQRWFAQGFSNRLFQRLLELKARSEAEPVQGEYALAIQTDDEALREEFYNLFPQYRPETPEQRAARRAETEAERQAEAERRAKLTDAQRRAEDEKAEREARRAQRRWDKYVADNTPDEKAWAVGTQSAEKVRLLMNDEFETNTRLLDA